MPRAFPRFRPVYGACGTASATLGLSRLLCLLLETLPTLPFRTFKNAVLCSRPLMVPKCGSSLQLRYAHLSVSLSLSLSLYLSVSLSPSLSLSPAFFHFLTLSLPLSLSLFLCFFFSLSLSLSHSLSLCFSLSPHITFTTYQQPSGGCTVCQASG